MTSTDFNMLRLEAPRDILRITDGMGPAREAAGEIQEVSRPATWLRALVKQQKQAEQDLAQLVQLCGNTVDHTDQRIRQIEQAYRDLSEGTRYVYDRLSANEQITGDWIRSELASTATAYQAFAQNGWGAIIERSREDTDKQAGQATQLARLNDSISFLAEANIARSQHLANFQGNVEVWAEEHQKRIDYLEQQLVEARQETQRQAETLQQLAAQIRTPETPLRETSRQATPEPAAWRSPARPSTSSLASALRQLRAVDDQPMGIPKPTVPPRPERRARRQPALPPSPERRLRPNPFTRQLSPEPRPPLGPIFGGGGDPPRPPRRPLPPPPSPTPPPEQRSRSPNPPQRTLTTEELARSVAAAVANALSHAQTRTIPIPEPRIKVSRLKMANPETFDGSPSTSFNTWWRSVTKYLGFYPETGDRQKIAWVGSLLTGTAKAWDLHRYDTMGEADTWVNYSSAIRTEYMDMREAANAQIKLGQLKYSGDIRAYFTEFRALNQYARATGEGLQEKINIAMTSEILRMRFAHYKGGFVDDNDFMEATYQAGLQVEEMKALEKTREAARIPGPKNNRPDGKGKEDHRKKDEERAVTKQQDSRREDKRAPTRKKAWVSLETALKGVPTKEREEYKTTDGCWRCGRPGHKTFECYAFTTAQGTSLPVAPWKTAAVTTRAGPTGGKRKATEEADERLVKQQKVATVEPMVTEGADPPRTLEATPWDDSDSDF